MIIEMIEKNPLCLHKLYCSSFKKGFDKTVRNLCCLVLSTLDFSMLFKVTL